MPTRKRKYYLVEVYRYGQWEFFKGSLTAAEASLWQDALQAFRNHPLAVRILEDSDETAEYASLSALSDPTFRI